MASADGETRRGPDLSGVTLIGTDILRRDLIDIGFGVDGSFVDMVPAA